MIIRVFCVFLLAVFSAKVLAVTLLEVGTSDPKEGVESYKFKAPYKEITSAYLELGDDLSLLNVAITAKAKEKFRVQLQLETSMTVMNEGPHLDLTGWKHCTTDWIMAKKLSEFKFALPNFEEIDISCFPKVSSEEIKEEVLKRGGEHWVKVIEEAPSEYSATDVGISSARIKVEKLVDGKWLLVTVLDFYVPLGC
ncbi:MAG: hypothetical protein COA42_22655 [Alteromonadaceae bacterium]|nr:MAG: hypothetical protein COA42_22655 [Alteromonadaceae bacterium]